ncbi:transcriptional regulator family: Fungal Specific TF [Paecilomyces variotii]|nr:transcriptional regulator family: Fungal Specific TF [Paecilomyces variotii]KAJ9210601.1 transcriptional regulator family: Fungal Specific TF [Paecilomyces variotii]KAJ9230781.1 transcriptional regulator family: Fungal Specific TF [Paecilomyces variotii]KAJ9266994.1 transcriptional regulator family: Fungal Specific TF [Paecilomyces variotii]KAJ9290580.1 transcriptional regulator family: Fungal Specific TF [Paecilomyces variotii]
MPAGEQSRVNGARGTSEGTGRSKRRRVDTENKGKQEGELDGTPQKRQRVSRACDQCRSKKDKCDGAQPECSTCVSLRRPCTYRTNPKKRGLPTGYIRTLELLWGLAFSEIEGSEEVVRVLLRKANILRHLAAIGKEGEAADTPHATWKNSVVLKEIEKLLSVLEQHEDDAGTTSVGDSSNALLSEQHSLQSHTLVWNVPDKFASMGDALVSPGEEPKRPIKPKPSIQSSRQESSRQCGTQTDLPELPAESNIFTSSLARPHNPAHLTITDSVASSGLHLPSNAWQLFDIYFSYTQCWFPIIEKHDMLRAAFSYSDRPMNISSSSPDSGEHAAMWATMALASVQNESSASSQRIPSPHFDRLQSERIYAISRNLIPQESENYGLGHIQALLLLSLVKLGQRKWHAAWTLIGHAVRISLYLRLDQPSLSSPRDVSDGKANGRRKHIFLACFALETLVASQTGNLPYLSRNEAMAVGPLDEDGLEEWHPWEDMSTIRPERTSSELPRREPLHALSTFNHFISLLCILNDLCRRKRDKLTTLAQLELIVHDLQRWLADLPAKYHVQPQADSSYQLPPHLLCLHIAYQSIVTALYIEALQKGPVSLVQAFRIRLVDSARRVARLMEAYISAYGVSATMPIFEIFLKLTGWEPWSRETPSPILSVSPDLLPVFRSLSSQISRVWAATVTPLLEVASVADIALRPIGDASRSSPSAVSDRTTLSSHKRYHSNDMNSRRDIAEIARPSDLSFDATVAPSWTRTLSDVTMSAVPQQSPSLAVPDETFESSPDIHRGSIIIPNDDVDRNTTGITAKVDPPMLPEFSSALQPARGPYHQTNTGTDPSLGPVLDIDGYGPAQKSRIAPDLDTLFDELASLDGGDNRTDNQPEFMQNLGFAPDSGVSELYSYYSQLDPLLPP